MPPALAREITHEEGVDEELDEEEIAVVGLGGSWEGTEDRAGPAQHVGLSAGRFHRRLKCHQLRVVLSDEQESGQEGAKNLGEDVVRDLLPGEPLPDRQTDGDGRVEVAARRRCTGYDGERDADCVGPPDLEQGSVYLERGRRLAIGQALHTQRRTGAHRLGSVEEKRCPRGYTRVPVAGGQHRNPRLETESQVNLLTRRKRHRGSQPPSLSSIAVWSARSQVCAESLV